MRFRDLEVSDFYIGESVETENEDVIDTSSLPLDSHGSTLQESLLSHRVIRYGRTKIFWQCKETAHSEDTDVVYSWQRSFGPLDVGFLISSDNLYPKSRVVEHLWAWYRIVEDFSRREFSRETDKLTAFAGIASMFGSKKGNEKYQIENGKQGKPVYLAGLWSNLFPTPYFGARTTIP